MLLALVTGCKSTYVKKLPPSTNAESLLNDQIFPNHQQIEIESQQEIFALDDTMMALAKRKLKPIKNIKKRSVRLVEHLFEEENIGLEYKSTANYTAQETYYAQSANCMSLTILAYVLAKESGLDVEFQEIDVPEYWVRNGQYSMLTGHINLKLIKPDTRNSIYLWGSDILEIDFDPTISKKKFDKKIIDKNTVIAMFYNNKGANALALHDSDRAYRYFKESISYDPYHAATWSNLAILYRQSGNLDLAEQSYKHAIAIKEDNLTALTNLALLYRLQGKHEVAHNIEADIHNKRRKNPYYHALLADEAFARENYPIAMKYYRSAIKLNKQEHSFYFGLAKTYFKLNQLKESEQAMQKAIALNKFTDTNNNYLAKLNFIKDKRLH